MTADDRKDYRSLGEILRDAREERELSIEDLSDLTKISPKMLMAIEADDLDRVVDPVYAKSFVRNLAEAFGLDARWLLAKLEHANAAQKPDPVVTEGEERRDDTKWHIEEDVRIQKVETPRTRSFPRLAVGVIVGVLLAAAGFWLIQRGSSSSGADGESSSSTPPARQAEMSAPQTALMQDAADASSPEGEASADVATENTPPVVSAPPTQTPVKTEEKAEEKTPAKPPVTETSSKQPDPASTADETAADPSPEKTSGATGTATPSPPPSTEKKPPATAGDDRAAEAPAPEETDDASTAAPEEEVVVSEEGTGLPSIVRQADEATQPTMKLIVTAVEKVDVVLAADGKARRMRTLDVGDTWAVEGHDHFSLEVSDPQRVRVELDGIHRDPPPGLTGEWILYPNPSPR